MVLALELHIKEMSDFVCVVVVFVLNSFAFSFILLAAGTFSYLLMFFELYEFLYNFFAAAAGLVYYCVMCLEWLLIFFTLPSAASADSTRCFFFLCIHVSLATSVTKKKSSFLHFNFKVILKYQKSVANTKKKNKKKKLKKGEEVKINS